jgi:hypothetical protein
MPGGKPRAYTPEGLLSKFEEYMKQENTIKNIVGFCNFADIHRDVFYTYKNEFEEYNDTIKKIETELEDYALQLLLTAKNPAGAIFYMKNKFGYADKMEVKAETTVNTELQSLSKEELEEELRKLGYKKEE